MSKEKGLYTSAEQTTVPTSGVSGRKLAVGIYYTGNVCGASCC